MGYVVHVLRKEWSASDSPWNDPIQVSAHSVLLSAPIVPPVLSFLLFFTHLFLLLIPPLYSVLLSFPLAYLHEDRWEL